MTDTPRNDPESTTSQDVSPNNRRRRKGVVARVVLYPLILYSTYCAVLFFAQDSLIFPASMAPPPLKFPPVKSTQEWQRTRDDGSKGVAWFVPAPGASADNPRPVTIFFHGNAEIIDHQVPLIEGYMRMGCSVLLPEYPGYGRAEGAPGQRAIMEDAEYFVSELLKRKDVDAARIYLHGRSIGGGPAAQLAAIHEPAALILESTFTSMASFADGYLAPRFLVRHPFRTDRAVESLHAPLLIMHGTRDTLIPPNHAHELQKLAAQSTHVRLVEYDCGHVDFPGRDNEDDCWRKIETFLSENAGLDPNRNRTENRKTRQDSPS